MTTLSAAFSARLGSGRSNPFRAAAVEHVARALRNGAPNVGAAVQPFAWSVDGSFAARLWSLVNNMDAIRFRKFEDECWERSVLG